MRYIRYNVPQNNKIIMNTKYIYKSKRKKNRININEKLSNEDLELIFERKNCLMNKKKVYDK